MDYTTYPCFDYKFIWGYRIDPSGYCYLYVEGVFINHEYIELTCKIRTKALEADTVSLLTDTETNVEG